MMRATGVGVFHQDGRYGIWVQAQVTIGDKKVDIEVTGDPHFDDYHRANYRARRVLDDLGRTHEIDLYEWGYDQPIDDDGNDLTSEEAGR